MNGQLASVGGEMLPLTVLKSNNGYYIGTVLDGMPYSRESVEYFPTEAAASEALSSGSWRQRQHP